MRGKVAPTTTTQTGPGRDVEVVESHPAYGQVSVARCNGSIFLYGSDFRHHSFVRMAIHSSTRRRNLSSDWYAPEPRPIIEVSMSESQWARMVSSLNVGGGVPCTIDYADGEMKPELTPPAPKTSVFARELETRLDDAIKALEELKVRMADGKGGKTSYGLVDRAIQQIRANTQFVASQFGDYMEEVVEKAKEEVNAHAAQTYARMGVENPEIPPQALPGPSR